MEKPKSVNHYIESIPQWSNHLTMLRSIVLKAGLVETVKWSFPVYTYKKKNLVSLGGFKNYVGIWFFYGSFLIDENNVLIHGENAKTMMQMRFPTLEDISEEQIHHFIQQSVLLVDDGVKLPKVQKGTLIVPKLLKEALEKHDLTTSFEIFSTSKKREFSEFLTSAKRETTVLKRLGKIIPMIEKNIGLNDKYRKC